jgi:type I site-specific restriction endonuclease
MVKLNLPEFDYNLKKAEGKVWIFDVIRKRFVVLTPEEWVRQHFIHYVITESKYPRSLIKIETGLIYNQLRKRSDIVVYDRVGAPWMIIECKSPDQELNQQTLQQVTVYNHTLKAKYFAITNGLKHFCVEVNRNGKQNVLLKEFPDYG